MSPHCQYAPWGYFSFERKSCWKCFHCEILISQIWHNYSLKGHCVRVLSLPVSYWLSDALALSCHALNATVTGDAIRTLKRSFILLNFLNHNQCEKDTKGRRESYSGTSIHISLVALVPRQTFKYALIIHHFAEDNWTHRINDTVFWSPRKASLGLHHNTCWALL